MYDYIRGTLAEVTPSSVVLDVTGLGYRIFIPFNNFVKMPAVNETLALFTSFVIRENSQSLYGFLTRHERDLFEQLLTTSGIGPKTALSLVGHLDYGQLIGSIRANDTQSLCRVPGIGKKTAERLVLEIKDKLPSVLAAEEAGPWILKQDAIRALVHLGYAEMAAQKAVTSVLKKEEEIDLSSLITLALRECSR